MDMDPRAMPSPEATEDLIREIKPEAPKAEETTSKNEPTEATLAELESLKAKNLELQKQKEHWREKYERDAKVPKSSELDDEAMSDEGKLLKGEITTLKEKLFSIEKEKEEQMVYSKYPQLQDKKDEFIDFMSDPENAGLKMEKAAKLFILEKGLLDSKPARAGLEKPTGGNKSQNKSGISNDDIKRLRENQPRRYLQMLRAGKIDPDQIS